MTGRGFCSLMCGLLLAACVSQRGPDTSLETHERPVVIAHRGASGYLPEHTLEAYKLAIKQGADFIEPDLVMTKDGVLVARHDPWLSDSTNIADIADFADRKTTLTGPDGGELTDWFVWDFTLDEIRQLRARQVRQGRDQSYDDTFLIPTFDEVLELASEDCDTSVGFYPETKWPSHHQARGLDMAGALESSLSGHVAKNGCLPPLRIQSFEAEILKTLNARTSYKLVQLVFPENWAANGTPSYALDDLADYADGVGPYKALLFDVSTGQPTDYAERARALGLEVHPWTLRDDDIAPGFSSPEAEIEAILDAGATGFFTDFPDTGRKAVKEYIK